MLKNYSRMTVVAAVVAGSLLAAPALAVAAETAPEAPASELVLDGAGSEPGSPITERPGPVVAPSDTHI
ncbi:hypothetical protein [Streptomyces sp. NPDC056308]|uniref:hypothetical protein n=1 Tax=unclassified Streptomyces TaxID=2593676 RepID=UPI0035D62CAA